MLQIFQLSIRPALFTLLMIAAAVVNAQSLESLLMPGPVTKAHEKFEQDCNQCHNRASKEKQGHLCLQCHDHENILDDLNKNAGFHGRLPKESKYDCKHCHTEHEGRNAKIVLLNPSTFNHQNTDFHLKGAHKKASCNACHKENKKYSEAPLQCYGCHKDDDSHKGKQGKKCGSCHKPTNWKESKFDHDKTDFPLKGAHEEARCDGCHINRKYKDTPTKCISCHQINDVHRGGYGKECDSCHNSEKWQDIHFDHNKKTDFPLYGKHKKASCNSCHQPSDLKSKKSKKKIPKKCYGCHKNDDSHKGRYGKNCDTCHKTSSWQKQYFDHDKKTDFPLRGKHKEATCIQCHKGNLYKKKSGSKKTDTKCINCHKTDDVHKGKQGDKCDNCHNEKGWHENVFFDHDLSRFPLIGMHAATECEECHITAEYDKTPLDCNACHEDDDEHKTRLGTDCESCHNPNSWATWIFNHDRDTDFKLDGAHKKLGCYDCHRTKSNGKLQASKDCISCHRSDDIHNRQFGGQCGNCHTTKNFRDTNIR